MSLSLIRCMLIISRLTADGQTLLGGQSDDMNDALQVGNAVTDNYYDNLGTVTYWWSHAMISDRTYKQLIHTCDFRKQKESNECESLYSYAMDQEFGNIDQYNIYAPPCNNSDGTSSYMHQTIRLPHRPQKVRISYYLPVLKPLQFI